MLGIGESSLILVTEDPGPICSGSWPWIRKRAHRCWSWMRPGSGDVFRRHAHGTIRWRPFFIVLGVVSMAWLVPWSHGCARKHGRFAVEKSGADSSKSEANDRCGAPAAPIWRKLRLVLRDHLAAIFIWWRERHFSMGTMAKIGGMGVFVLRGCARCFSLDFPTGGSPPVDRRLSFARLLRVRERGAAGLLLLGCALQVPRSVILLLLAFPARRHVRIQYMAITQTLAGPKMAGRWTGLQNFVEICRRHRTGSDRFVIITPDRSSWLS